MLASKGFTLIELMIVAAILGIILAVAFPHIMKPSTTNSEVVQLKAK